jgi:hypothetical protein
MKSGAEIVGFDGPYIRSGNIAFKDLYVLHIPFGNVQRECRGKCHGFGIERHYFSSEIL